MSYRRTEKVSKKAEERMQSILQAAKEEFSQNGFYGTSIKEIAHKAKVGIGTVYLYVRNKEELFSYLVDEAYKMVLDRILQSRKNVTGSQEKIRISMISALEIIRENEELARVMLVQSPSGYAKVREQLSVMLNGLSAYVEENILECIEKGELPAQDAHIASQAFIGTFYHVVVGWLRDGLPPDFPAAEQSLLEYNLRGLGFPTKSDSQ